jgi:tol-pal system protein YbgF
VQTRWIVIGTVAVALGVFAGSLLAPQPANGVSKEMVQLMEQVSQLQQAQQDFRSAYDQNTGQLRLLVEQALDSTNKLSSTMAGLQDSMQKVEANSGSRMDTLTTTTQAISDNQQVVQERLGKLGQQVTDMQNTLQSIDAKLSGGAPPAGAGAPGGNADANGAGGAPAPGGDTSAPTPANAEVLYSSALRDFTGGNYAISRQEFTDYLKYFPDTDLASNAEFYLGEIAYSTEDYKASMTHYNAVITNYPKSFKLAAAHLKKGQALLQLGQRASATREFREVLKDFPGTDEARRAQYQLKQLGVKSAN